LNKEESAEYLWKRFTEYLSLNLTGEGCMVKRQFICKNCGHKFTAEVFEKGEAEEKGLKAALLRCPKCNSTSVERI